MVKKKITFILDDLDKAADKQYVKDVIDSIIDSLYDFPSYVTNISLDKTNAHVYIKFDLGICHTGDMVWCLITTWLECIVQTEQKINVSIIVSEPDDIYDVEYKLLTHLKQNKDEV